MKLVKLFDCQEMPLDIRDAFFEFVSRDDGPSNDCCVEFEFAPSDFWDGDGDEKCATGNASQRKQHKTVLDWLLTSGAEVSDESVVIKHWW